MSTLDYYAEARKISANLKSIGRETDGRKLLDAIDAGSTGTEILMALRYHLTNLLKDKNLPVDIIASATILSESINSALS
jgi:hypothetical protein